MRRFTKFVTATAVAALTLTACGGDDGGATAGGPRGFTLSFDGDLDKLSEASDDPMPEGLRSLFEDTLMTGAFDPEGGGVAFTIGGGDGLFAMRAFEDSYYLRIDLAAMANMDPGGSAGFDPADIRSQVDQFGAFLDQELIDMIGAALDGEWVGITDVDEETASELMSSLGVDVPDPSEAAQQQKDIQAQFESLLTIEDGTLSSDYLVLEGDGPTYSATLRARELVAFFNGFVAEYGNLGGMGGMAPGATQIPVDDVPEEIGGFEVTVDGDQVQKISADLYGIGQSLGEDTEGMAEGDAVFNLEFGEPGDLLTTPANATTIPFEDLAEIIESFGSMMMPAA